MIIGMLTAFKLFTGIKLLDEILIKAEQDKMNGIAPVNSSEMCKEIKIVDCFCPCRRGRTSHCSF